MLSVAEKAAEQRQAAANAIELLEARLGPDLPRFADLLDKASFRFRPALSAHIAGAHACNPPELSGASATTEPQCYDVTAVKR